MGERRPQFELHRCQISHLPSVNARRATSVHLEAADRSGRIMLAFLQLAS